MSHWTDLRVFRPFYSQTASCLYLPDALLGGFGSFRLTFSDDSGHPDALVCIFVVRERLEEFRVNFFFEGKISFFGSPGSRGLYYYTLYNDLRQCTSDLDRDT